MAFSKDSFERLLIDGVKLTEKILGKGAYGKVVEVVWNGTVCAAKQVHEIFIKEVSPAERARVVKDFEREFQTWAKLRHPNIVILLGVFFIKDSPRIVLEKMDTSLRLYLEKHTKADFPLVHKIDVLKQVAQGLSYLHNQNPPLVHHDLSPNNILLNEISFSTKLTDFGMTRAISPSALTRMSSIKGTLPFMAPESLRSQPRYDDKLDTFSYGNIIISTVTHKWPIPCDPNRYEGEKLVALTEYERREEYIKLFDDDEKKILAPTVKHCLENRPERRPTSLTLVDEINAASINFKQAKTWSQQVLDLRNERQQFVDQAASCQESIKALQERIVAEEEEKIALQTANIHLLEEKRAVQGTNTRLVEEKAALQGANTRLVEEKAALQGANTRLVEEKAALQGANTRLMEEKTALQGANTHLVGEKRALQGAITHLVEEKTALQGANTRLVEEKTALQGANTHLVEEKKVLEGTITHLVEEKKVLQGENTDLAERKRTLQGLNKHLVEEKSTLQTLCTHLQGANTCLQKDKKALQICCAHFQDASAQLQGASAQLQEEIKNFQGSYSKVNLEIGQLQAAAAVLQPDVKTQLEEVGPLLDTRLQKSDLW